jgi:hypothetical protein
VGAGAFLRIADTFPAFGAQMVGAFEWACPRPKIAQRFNAGIVRQTEMSHVATADCFFRPCGTNLLFLGGPRDESLGYSLYALTGIGRSQGADAATTKRMRRRKSPVKSAARPGGPLEICRGRQPPVSRKKVTAPEGRGYESRVSSAPPGRVALRGKSGG